MKDAPLWETAGLLAVMGLLAVPLSAVTGRRAAPAPPAAGESAIDHHGLVETTVRVRSAHPFTAFVLRRDDEVLGRLAGPAREGEFTCRIDGADDWLVVEAELAGTGALTALAVEFWPEGLPTEERTFWGEGHLVEELHVEWLHE